MHDLTPRFDRIAVVRQNMRFTPDGHKFTWANWTNMAFGNGGQENPCAGRGDFYALRYGPYLIGMNMSRDQTFALAVPADVNSVKELVSCRNNVAPVRPASYTLRSEIARPSLLKHEGTGARAK